MHNFYGFKEGNHVFLNKEEITHAIKSLRLGIGDAIQIFDGFGNIYIGDIDELSRKQIRISNPKTKTDIGIVEGHLHIGIAPTKSIDRWNFFLEKATEIGVHEITPILTSHSERKFLNHDRSEKIIRSACLQSQKSIIPKLNKLTPLSSLLNISSDCNKYIATCGDKQKNDFFSSLKQSNSFPILILIGPEGDFTEEELRKANSKKFVNVSFGLHRLRTETAGIYAATSFSQKNGNL
ncbi:MAG: RsmE family RNA methyltransferase [Schleiferiaceae bacterium]|nr:RsmE family RNA methyltransferase [Schleiferiaceae bacterium]